MGQAQLPLVFSDGLPTRKRVTSQIASNGRPAIPETPFSFLMSGRTITPPPHSFPSVSFHSVCVCGVRVMESWESAG